MSPLFLGQDVKYFNIFLISDNWLLISFFSLKDGPIFTVNTNKTTVNKISGDVFTESCSAEGWPLPLIDWYYNEKPITNISSVLQPKSPYIIINHHRHLTASSHIVVSNLSQSLSGVYSCIINGKISAKNVTLLVNSNSQNNIPIGKYY